MANQVKSQSFGTTAPGEDILYVELGVDLSSSGDGAAATAYTVFPRAFSETPRIIGMGVSGLTPIDISCQPSLTGITFSGAAISVGLLGGGTIQVSATLRGKIA